MPSLKNLGQLFSAVRKRHTGFKPRHYAADNLREAGSPSSGNRVTKAVEVYKPEELEISIKNCLGCGLGYRTVMIIRPILCTVIIMACSLFGGHASAEDAKVLVISGDQHESTQRTIKGIKQGIRSSGISARIDLITVTPGENEKEALTRKKSEFAPDVVVTVGSRSTRLAKTLIDDTPIVFASVLNPVTSGFIDSYDYPGNMLTGASLDIAVDIQLEKFRQLVPSISRIGVLHSDQTRYIVNQAIEWAASHSIKLISYEVVAPKDMPEAVDSLMRSCDGLWAIPDELIYTPQSTKHILLETFRNRIPIMGFSPSFVKSGALFALSVDHKFIGLQAGELVAKILHGATPGQLAVTTPEAPYLYINRNTAEKLRIQVNPDFYTVAKEVYE